MSSTAMVSAEFWTPGETEELPEAIQLSKVVEAPAHNQRGYERDSHRAPAMEAIEKQIATVAPWNVPVILRGETGVGKEVMARLIHDRSSRASHPFIKVNCVALPVDLLESELFGYEKGAFTGASQTKPGKFEAANGGTILLDEIGDMDLHLQAKLLHVLQDKEVQRLGSRKSTPLDVRVLAATHCNLEEAIEAGRFRSDLYHRLNVVSLHVPALRERRSEILPLANTFLQRHSQSDAPLPEIPRSLASSLLAHDWPGNVRELENLMRKYLVFEDPQMIQEELYKQRTRSTRPTTVSTDRHDANGDGNKLLQDDVEIYERTGNAENHGSEASAELVYRRRLDGRQAVQEIRSQESAWEQPSGSSAQTPSTTTVTDRENRTHMDALRPEMTSEQPPSFAALTNHVEKVIRETLDTVVPEKVNVEREVDNGEEKLPTLEQLDAAAKEEERRVIQAALQRTSWNRKKAAVLLDVDYKALLYRMNKLGL